MTAQPPSFTPRRLDAARHLLSPDHLLASFALGRQPHLRNSLLAGLQAGLTVVIALPLFYLSPYAHLVGFAALGALVARDQAEHAAGIEGELTVAEERVRPGHRGLAKGGRRPGEGSGRKNAVRAAPDRRG